MKGGKTVNCLNLIIYEEVEFGVPVFKDCGT